MRWIGRIGDAFAPCDALRGPKSGECVGNVVVGDVGTRLKPPRSQKRFDAEVRPNERASNLCTSRGSLAVDDGDVVVPVAEAHLGMNLDDALAQSGTRLQ